MEELTELGGNSRNFTTKMGTIAIFMGILWDSTGYHGILWHMILCFFLS